MKNTEVFNDYDMVVSITEDTINAQLTHLVKMGTIQPEFILIQELQGNAYVYTVADSVSQVPVDSDGNPTASYIDGQILPQVQISESGTNITFVLTFRSGTAYFWSGNGPLATLTRYDMTGWSYGIDVDLDLAAIAKDDIGKKIAVPKNVEDQLSGFLDNMFSVSSLFMDFESTDLMRFDPVHSSAGSAGDPGLQQLVLFMNFYLKDLQASGDPYILGYALAPGDSTVYAPGEAVPDQLAPVGTTYTMYHDPDHQGLSNLNFVLATKGGHGAITGTPGNFDSNWISPTEQCDAKMIYSHSCLVEPFILEPFYNLLQTNVWNSVMDQLGDLNQGNNYKTGRSNTSTGLSYTLANFTSGDEHYVNTYTATLTTAAVVAPAAAPAGGNGAILGGNTDLAVLVAPGVVTDDPPASAAIIQLGGSISFSKEVSKNLGCTATADASQSEDWSATIQVQSAKDAQGLPTLTVAHTAVSVTNQQSDSSRNDCAKAWDIVGKILDGILAGFTMGLSTLTGGGGPLDDVFDLKIPGLGDLGALFDNLGSSLSPAVLLPAGNEFFFKDPAIDAEANLSAELTYKADS